MPGKKAIILSAPSGSGKTTIVHHLIREFPELQFSVSATSRPKRGNEVFGRDYYFLTREEFIRNIEQDQFIEWEEVYKGIYYGTLKSEIEKIWRSGKSVIFDVDVKGGIKLKKYFGPSALSIFITVSGMDELEKRIRNRQTDLEESILKRLRKAEYEMSFMDKFDEIILNDHLPAAVGKVEQIVKSFLRSS